jgi:hypothetical protein
MQTVFYDNFYGVYQPETCTAQFPVFSYYPVGTFQFPQMVIPVKSTHDVIEIDSDPVRFQTQSAVFNQLGIGRELFYQMYFFGKD